MVGGKLTDFKEHYATNYSLILLIRNVKNKGIIHRKLVEEAVNIEIFTNFINNIKLPTNEKYHLLIDRLPVHKSEKVRKALEDKNIERRLIVACNPYLNPVEEVFHVIKQYVEKQKPTTERKLRTYLNKIINELQKEDMTKYFRDCLDYDFIFKSGN